MSWKKYFTPVPTGDNVAGSYGSTQVVEQRSGSKRSQLFHYPMYVVLQQG